MNRSVIVIGGGASGMMAAIFAADEGASVTILEHTDRVGKKLLSTGNGRCNFSNRFLDASCYRSGRADFPMEVIGRFPVEATVSFFESLGIVTKDRDGYLYPRSGQASSMVDVLREALSARGVSVVTECIVREIREREEGGYDISTSEGAFRCDALILAAGSKAAPATGSDGSGYELAKKLGHRVIKPLPALVQLRCGENFFRQIAGVRTEASVAVWAEGECLGADRGELQLTDYGISGIPVFQVSRFAARALDQGKRVTAVIDFFPEATREETEVMVRARAAACGPESLFTGWLPKKLGLLLLKLAGPVRDSQGGWLTEKLAERFTSLIKEFEVEVAAVNPFENAQVCCGGVDVGELWPETMESKKRRGLYLVGELVDVDGICGGYNLQWAWSSGALAGRAAGGGYGSGKSVRKGKSGGRLPEGPKQSEQPGKESPAKGRRQGRNKETGPGGKAKRRAAAGPKQRKMPDSRNAGGLRDRGMDKAR